MLSYLEILKEIAIEIRPLLGKGKVADYIPGLKEVDPRKFGIALAAPDGIITSFGDAEEGFSIQSISKVFTLSMAFARHGEELWKRVNKEPSGNPFNSLVQLEHEKGIPRNPFINAGALVITDMLVSDLKNPKEKILDFVRKASGNKLIEFDQQIASSEKENGYLNASLVNYMKSHGNIHNDVEAVLDVYFHQCSIRMSCVDLAKAMLYFVHHGIIPSSGERILTVSQTKRLSAVMLTCGFYDQAGDFAFQVGMPGKSGVGGGIVAIIPGKFSIAVWSPELNPYGNSLAGMKALELFTTKTGISIF